MNRTVETGANICCARYGTKLKPSVVLLRMICSFIIFLTKPQFIKVLRTVSVTAGAMLFLFIVNGMENGAVPLIIGTPICFILALIAFAAAEKCDKEERESQMYLTDDEGCFDEHI